MNNECRYQSCPTSIPLEDINAILSKPLPKGVKVERDMMGYGTVITYRRIPVDNLISSIVFTLFWSFFTMLAFTFEALFIGIPFLIAGIALVSIILFRLFGKWVIHLDRGHGAVIASIGKLGWKRTFTYNPHSTVKIQSFRLRGGERTLAIIIKTGNRKFTFRSSITVDAGEFIAATLTHGFQH